jgi:TPR repeat protein
MLLLTACSTTRLSDTLPGVLNPDETPDTRKLEPAPAERTDDDPDRKALVIGNSDYAGENNDLVNPANDADSLAESLKQRGFTVHQGTNLTARRMNQAVDRFVGSIESGDIALFYYAGHGVGLGTTKGDYNFLIPVKADIQQKADVRYEAVNASQVLARISEKEPRFTMLLLDACRDNPYGRNWRSAGTAGWTKMSGRGGSLIVFGTEPGTRASDNPEGRNGLFTKWLLEYIDEPGLEVSSLIRKVREKVGRASGGRQQPSWTGGYSGNFFFTPEGPQAKSSQEEVQENPPFKTDPVYSKKDTSFDVEEVYREGRSFYFDDKYNEALPRMKQAAAVGHAAAQEVLGAMYEAGQGVEEDWGEAVWWYRNAAEQGDNNASFNLGKMYAKGEGVEKDEAEALRWLRKAAKRGDPIWKNKVGDLLAEGHGVVEENEVEAVRWYRKAVEEDSTAGFRRSSEIASARFRLGDMYAEGRGVEEDEKEAVRWYRKAAQQGHARHKVKLGDMYAKGSGIMEKNEQEAVRWYRKAAEQGDADARYKLGKMYAEGRGVAKDKAEAVRWYRKAAQQGHARHKVKLGDMYAKGSGIVEKNEQEAVRWYRKAAEKGYAWHKTELGDIYAEGRGTVQKDETKALHWYCRAAQEGDSDAKKSLKSLGSSIESCSVE